MDGLGHRHPDQLGELAVGTDDAVPALDDMRRVDGEEAGIEALRPSRRGDRPGDEVQRAEIGQHAGLRELRPQSGRCGGRGRHLAADQQPGFLERLADGGEGERARLVAGRALHMLHQPRLDPGIERRRDRHLAVGGLDPAARKHELAGQEFVAVMTAAEQHLRRRTGAIDDDQGRGVLRTDGGRGLIAIGVGQALGARGVIAHRLVSVIGFSVQRGVLFALGVPIESMHAVRPLPSDDCALDRLQQAERRGRA